jgi:hypothetical protein
MAVLIEAVRLGDEEHWEIIGLTRNKKVPLIKTSGKHQCISRGKWKGNGV